MCEHDARPNAAEVLGIIDKLISTLGFDYLWQLPVDQLRFIIEHEWRHKLAARRVNQAAK